MSSIDAIDVVNTVESMGTIKAIDTVSGAILLEETYRYNTLLEGERDDRWVVGARSSERFADCRVPVSRMDQNALNGDIRNKCICCNEFPSGIGSERGFKFGREWVLETTARGLCESL